MKEVSEQKNVQTPQSQKSKKKLIIAIILLIVAIGVVLWLLLHDSKRNVVVTEDNVEQVVKHLDDYTPAGSYEVRMNSTWDFPDGSSPSDNAYVENVVNNTTDVYFDLIMADTGEVILESPVIPRGAHMNKITLDKDLAAGTYDCIVEYHLIDEKQNTLSTVNVGVTINIAQ